MKFQQSELWVIDSLAEKATVGIAPNAFLRYAILHKLYVSNQRYAVPAGEITNTRFRVMLKMCRFAVQLGTF